ncbi:glycosyl hydrolase family 28-related protein [Polyangium sp. y55x31]|uniref:glycosyl hydrolase family 28-related protein n=1 Tax=Polyangium sp. y55x31 TaxID=3042688 RepID=UPI002482354A|nr:glycosyl hydrolase family 28-related protein [Polyangium sp. y55x31]MDI1476278.1 glycosyl hydrolase family 28-related protein [Polyangium sp. y55x31]
MSVGDRILLHAQTAPAQNGIYEKGSSTWARPADFDAGSELLGATVFVSEGGTYGNTMWQCTTDGPITVGTTALAFAQLPNTIDKTRIDQLHGNLLGSAVTLDLSAGNATIAVGDGKRRRIVDGNLVADRTVTLSTTGAVAGDTISILREDRSQRVVRIHAGTNLSYHLGGPGSFVAQYDGTAWKLTDATRRNGERVVNVKDFGAKGDGVTNDTAAIQAALNVFSPAQSTELSGVVFFPKGVYLIDDTLTYRGEPGYAIHLRGEIGYSRGLAGTIIRWRDTDPPSPVGEGTKAMLHMMGANMSVLEDLEFDGLGLVKYCVHLDYALAAGGALAVGSSGTRITRCTMARAAGPNAVCLAIGPAGDTDLQTSEVLIESCYFLGHATHPPLAAIKTLSDGNTKNIIIRDTSIGGYTQYGVDWQLASGTLLVSGVNTAGTTLADYRIGGGEATIIEQASENANAGAMFITSSGAVTGSVKVIGGSWVGTATESSVVIKYFGTVTLIGLQLKLVTPIPESSAVGLRPRIQIGDVTMTGPQPGALYSLGCLYWNHEDYIDVIDATTNVVVANDYSNNKGLRVTSINDYAYDASTLSVKKLKEYHGNYSTLGPGVLYGHTSSAAYNGAGFTRNILHEPRSGWTKQTYTYEAFQDSVAGKTLIVGRPAPRAKLLAAYLNVTTPFTGTYGGNALDVRLKFGKTGYGQEYILEFDATTAAVTKGLADADLGTALARASAVQGGDLQSWGSYGLLYISARDFNNRLLSGLTAGAVEVIMKWEVLP